MNLFHVLVIASLSSLGLCEYRSYRRNRGNPFVSRFARQTDGGRKRSGSRIDRRQEQEDRADLDYDDNPRYNYRYDVNSPETNDIKMHQEMRDGDFTMGKYSLIEPDGTLMEVEYVVHGDAGYNAVVRRGGKETFHGPLAKELFGRGGSGTSGSRPGRPPGRRPGSSGYPDRPRRPLATYGVPLAPALGPDDRPGYAGRR